MSSDGEWFIYIEDRDQNRFAIAGPVGARQVQDWISAIVDEQDAGRNIVGQDLQRSQLPEFRQQASRESFVEGTPEDILPTPRDTTHDYQGSLPEYAQQADRGKLIKHLCKGKCGAVRWAVMNKVYPGEAALRVAPIGEYKATCLRCGAVAPDSYNWFR